MTLKCYTSVVKGLQLKVRKFLGLTLRFVEVTGEKLVGDPFCPPPPILNFRYLNCCFKVQYGLKYRNALFKEI